MTSGERDPQFEDLLEYLKHTRNFDFTGYKRSTLMRRVEHRMHAVGIGGFADYVDYLEVHPEEFAQLFNTILINVTQFFRDPPTWEYLEREILPRIINGKAPGEPIRVWSAGCASGEEAYTLAILLAEALGPQAYAQRVKIYATDVDEEALTEARHASYSAKALQSLPEQYRAKYFDTSGNRYVFRNDLRRAVIFGRHDLMQDAPISRLDLLVCRNTLMYFNSEAQARILARFYFALNDTGYLLLGKAELLLTHANLFSPVNMKYRVFTKVGKASLRDRLLVLAQAGDEEAGDRLGRFVQLRDVAYDASPVAQIVVDYSGNLALANERARLAFGLVTRDVGRPLQELEVSYRPVELRSRIEQAYAERHAVLLTDIARHLPDGKLQYFDVQVVPLPENGGWGGVSIVFNDVTRERALREELERSKQDLETAYEELQSSNEELVTTNEELQSTVEELETTNEELQSTNEELETMNEELQSTNEELQTINTELRQRTDEMNQANNFLSAVLSSLHTGVVVVDNRLNVLSWNDRAEDLWGVRSDEVLGQSFIGLDIGLPVDRLLAPIRSMLSGEQADAEVTVPAVDRRGRAIHCRIMATPLIGAKTERLGVILLMERANEG